MLPWHINCGIVGTEPDLSHSRHAYFIYLLVHACGTLFQRIYDSVPVSDSSNGH